ncbi:hypothetical protein HY993_01895 [Candidatus Micrarchaeota archaeon]|nr:hypothetical protein [Candidatus Micrarchaeota archaeon]
MKKFLEDNGGQVSVELLIIIAAVLAVAIILVSQLQSTANSGRETLAKKSTQVLNNITDIA